MDRYAIEARARADALLDLISEEQLEADRAWLEANATEEMWLFVMTLSPRVSTILSQPPSKDRTWAQTTPRPKFLREWLAARHWAIASARALSIASRLQDLKDRQDQYPYRQAVRDAASVANKWLDQPSTEDLLATRMLDQWSGEPVG